MATGVNFGTQQYFGFDPRSIPNCSIWSDANTLSSLANGTTVNSWSNLGSGGTVTATGTVSNAVLNTRTVVNFTTAQTWVTGTTVNLSRYSMFAVSRQTGVTNRRVLQSVTNNQLFGYWNGYKRSLYVDNNPNQLTTALSDTNWDLMAHTRIASGAYTFNWNGTSLFSNTTSAATNLTGLTINASANAPAETSTCQIAEIILYSSVLTTAQIQQIEGYLAWKWGLQANLPTSHPFKYYTPAMRVFQPVDLVDCALWFDGADTSTITGTSPVTAWVNKGTISTTATNSIGSATSGNTLNGENYIAFPSGVEMQFTAAINTQARTWFFVARMTTAFTANPQYWGPINATANGRDGVVVAFNGTTYNMYMGPNGISIPVAANIANPFNRVGIYSLVNSATASSNVLTDNGTPQTLTLSSAATGYNTGSAAVRVSTAGYNRGGDIMEILLFYGDLTPSDRQRVEGYLAWKWGLQLNLPTTHPFYRVLPSTAVFNPLAVSGCALWFDAADASTLTLSGSSVSTWSDKSGNGRNATQATSTRWPTLQTNQRNGLPAVKWDAVDDNLTGAMTYPTNGLTTLFVVYNQLSTTGNLRLFDINGNSYGNFGSPQASSAADAILWLGTGGLYTTLAPSTGWRMYSVTYSSGSSLVWRNGTSQALTATGTFTATPSGTGFTLGNSAFGTNGEVFNGLLGELVLYFGNLSTYNRQRMEGYLAWKWGLWPNLPTTHPHYKFRP